jgi:hypothetical protein
MNAKLHAPIQLGELVAAAFDEAAHFGSNPREVSRLATHAVMHILEGVQNKRLSRAVLLPLPLPARQSRA